MNVTTTRPPDRPVESVGHNYVATPFEKNFYTQNPEFSMENFIKKQIEAIFYLNKKMDLQAKIQIYWKTTEQKTLQLTSCSIVYSIIRDTIETIATKLRNLIDHSYSILTLNSKSLCKLSQTSASWQKNWVKFKEQSDPPSLLSVYPPLSNAYIMMYRHLCDCSREVYNLWKIIYDCITVKDLKCETFQQNISELILQIFTTPQTFEPKRMLPAISLVNKCKFINADSENVTKRLEYTKFQEDELAKNLMQATSNRKMRLSAEEYHIFRRQAQENIISHIPKRLDRSKLDHRVLFQEVRKQYIDTDKDKECVKCPSMVVEIDPTSTCFQAEAVQFCPEVKAELLDTFEAKHNLHYQLQDTSSQEDDLHTYYISGNSSNKDELIQQNSQIEVEQYPMQERHKEHEASAKLSSSTGIDENNDHNDLSVIKNYEFQTPPDFILQEGNAQCDAYAVDEKQDEINFDLSQKLIARLNHKSFKNEMAMASKEHHVGYNLQKIKKKISKQHGRNVKDGEDHSKYLHYEKQKLEKYRKELEKEKEELLREVERFVKEKEKDDCIYRMMNDEKYCQKSSRRPKHQYKYVQETKRYDFNRFRQEVAEETLDLIKPTLLGEDPMSTLAELIHKDSQSVKEYSVSAISESSRGIDDQDCQFGKLSKRQQKLRKRVEREMKAMKETQAPNPVPEAQEELKEMISQQEMQLTNFLQNLSINKNNRVPWHIEESRLQRWKMKLPLIRAKNPKEFTPPQNSKSQDQPSKSSKKKKKNRR